MRKNTELPDFIIIGAPRAGTTWMARNLAHHPQIRIPEIKEIHFFDRHFDKGIEYYRSFFKNCPPGVVKGEATPEYLYLEHIPERIYKTLGSNVKLIVSLRDPVDRLYSRYWNSKAKYKENRKLSFQEKILRKPQFIAEGFYFTHLQNYLRYFPRENILILFFEEIKSHPNEFLHKIYKFLGVDENFRAPLLTKRINTASSKGALARSKSLWLLFRLLRKIKLEKLSLWVEKVNRTRLPPLSPEIRNELIQNYYLSEIEKLETLLDISLEHWKR